MIPAVIVIATALVAAVVYAALSQLAAMRSENQRLTIQSADSAAQLLKVIGQGNAHPFEWDLLTNRLRATLTSQDTGSSASYDAAQLLRALHPDDAARVIARIDEIRRGSADTLLDEVRYRRAAHERWRSYVVSLRASRGGARSAPLVVGLALDLSAFRDAEEEASRSEYRFRELAEAMPQIVYVTGPNGQIEFANRRWKAYTGLDSAASESLNQVVHPEDLPRLEKTWKTAMMEGIELEEEFRLRCAADNRYRWFLTRSVPVRDASGTIVRWYGTSTDIEHVRATTQALEDADRRKNEFLATLAHELRNPLAPIRNAVSILERSTTHTELPWALGLMERQLKQMTRLIDDLMDVSRISEGRLELQSGVLDLRSVVQNAVEMCRNGTSAESHVIVVDAPSESIELSADGNRLAQVVANLVNNAIKYSDAGSTITIRVIAANGVASVSVNDEGVGIPVDQLDAIFEMFSQISASVSRSRGGLGIGLALVKRLVALHGGTVRAESRGSGPGVRSRSACQCKPIQRHCPAQFSQRCRTRNSDGVFFWSMTKGMQSRVWLRCSPCAAAPCAPCWTASQFCRRRASFSPMQSFSTSGCQGRAATTSAA